MKSLRFPGRLAIFLTLLTWGYFLCYLPTTDFDESLYRRVAEEMKSSHHLWQMTWDGWPVYHKPPVFYWLICLCSYLIDGASAGVSTFASRLPNFFASLGILMSLYQAGKKLSDGSVRSGFIPVLAFICALFPVMTATAVIFDPLQTFFLMPSLVLPALYFAKKIELKPGHWFGWSLSLFLACAVKGLNGLLLPSLALFFHLLFTLRTRGFRQNFNFGIRYFAFAFLPAALAVAGFYALLDQKIGPAFTHEFLWVQHFQRTQIPMEAHSGSVFYHLLILYFGGGFLIPLLLDRAMRTRFSYTEHAFALSYGFSFIFIFSITATKLPHYTWPMWPALALFFATLLAQVKTSPEPLARDSDLAKRLQRVFAFFPVLLLGMLMLALASQPERIFAQFASSLAAKSVLAHFSGFTWFERSCLYCGAIACFIGQVRRRTLTASVEACALLASVTALCLTLGLGRTVQDLMVKPYQDMNQALIAHGLKAGDCIRSSGAQSPTLSLALGQQILHNRCEPQDLRFLITPEWRASECEDRKLGRVGRASYLVLCKLAPDSADFELPTTR